MFQNEAHSQLRESQCPEHVGGAFLKVMMPRHFDVTALFAILMLLRRGTFLWMCTLCAHAF